MQNKEPSIAPIRSIILDDEPLARRVIIEYLQKHPDIVVVAELGDPVTAYEEIAKRSPDLLFLDIQMPEMNGFELLEQIENPPVVIFCTAYDEYAIQAFEVNAVDYLLKPFDQERFDQAVRKARHYLAQGNQISDIRPLLKFINERAREPGRLLVKKADRWVMIKPQDIYWAEACQDYSLLYSDQGKFLTTKSLKELESFLIRQNFLRIHRSTLVNLDYVKEVHPWGAGRYLLILQNGKRLECSKAGARKLKELLL
ncbi:MAG: LytTR family DNA-binding domain-containing protein [Calditrichia bacterium]